MGLIERFSGKAVAPDTASFIYFVEKDERYLDSVRALFSAILSSDFLILTSTVTP